VRLKGRRLNDRPEVPFQPELFAPQAIGFDAGYSSLQRIELDAHSWVDFAESWVRGADALFEAVLRARKWGQRSRWMYERYVKEPRLTSPWNAKSGLPLDPPIVEAMRASLSERYAVRFDSVGFNLYRNGQDSVAWHRDHIAKEIECPVIALVGLGEPRRLLLRPRGGGSSRPFSLGRGNLLVTGGRTNRDWEHAVPKVARAGPRISLAFRYGLNSKSYSAGTDAKP
jgi:alkylated DNA repair dioxygenase AlkB